MSAPFVLGAELGDEPFWVRLDGEWHKLDRVDGAGWWTRCGIRADKAKDASEQPEPGEPVHEPCGVAGLAAAAEPRVTWKPAHGNNWEAGHNRPIATVNHRMVGTLAGTTAYFQRGDHRPVSTHFGIGLSEIHQYVDVSDIAYGNGNYDPSGGWPLYKGTNPNHYTVSIEHQDGATENRGRVAESTITLSIWLNGLLLSGDAEKMRAAGIRIREQATADALQAIEPGKDTVIDHHRIAGNLKPYCWRPWLDDPGFPQARYLAALTPQPEPEDPDVPAVIPMTAMAPTYVTVREGADLFAAADGTKLERITSMSRETRTYSPFKNREYHAIRASTGATTWNGPELLFVHERDLVKSPEAFCPPAADCAEQVKKAEAAAWDKAIVEATHRVATTQRPVTAAPTREEAA